MNRQNICFSVIALLVVAFGFRDYWIPPPARPPIITMPFVSTDTPVWVERKANDKPLRIRAGMSTQGPLSCGTGADDSSTGSTAWSNPSNITASDDSYATASFGNSHYIKGTNFGFSIPTGATINSVLFEIERKKSGAGSITDTHAYMVIGGTIQTSVDKSAGASWPTSDTYASFTFSIPSDLSLSVSQANASDFGFVLSANLSTATGSVDHIRCTITYTEAATTYTISSTEYVGLTETIDRLSDASRNVNEPLGLADSVIPECVWNRAASDICGLADSVDRISEALRLIEVENYLALDSESFLTQSDAYRQWEDQVGLTETISRLSAAYRQLAEDILGLTDTPDRQSDASRQLTEDPLGLSDLIDVLAVLNNEFVVRINEYLGLQADTIATQSDASRQFEDPLGASDTVTRIVNVARALTEYLGLVDSLGTATVWAKTVGEYLGVVEFAYKANSFARSASDNVGLTDSAVRSVGFARGITEYAALVDSLSKLADASRGITEKIGLSETLARFADAARTITENAGIKDTPSRQANAARPVSENVGAADTPRFRMTLQRAISEVVGLLDSLARSATFRQRITEYAGLKDSPGLGTAFSKAISEALAAATSAARNADGNRGATENLGGADSTRRAVSGFRAITEALGASETAAAVMLFRIGISEFAGLVDSLARQSDASRTVSNKIGLQDDLTKAAESLRSISESLGFKTAMVSDLFEAAQEVWNAVNRLITWTANRSRSTPTASPTADEIPIKQPMESKAIRFEFSEELEDGENLAGTPTITCIPSGLTISSVAISGTKVAASISGGTDGQKYHLECIVQTDTGQTLECDGWLIVRNK